MSCRVRREFCREGGNYELRMTNDEWEEWTGLYDLCFVFRGDEGNYELRMTNDELETVEL